MRQIPNLPQRRILHSQRPLKCFVPAYAVSIAAFNADARRFAERIEPIVSNFCRGLADDDMMHRLRRDLGRSKDSRIVAVA